MSDASPDHYSVLGVEPDADRAAIRTAYRRRARQSHPDHGGDAEEFHQVQEAWDVLGDETRRRGYDRSRQSAGTVRGGGGGAPSDSNFTYGRGTRSRPAGSAQRSRSRGSGAQHSSAAQRPPLYEPDLSTPEPLSLPRTSQRIHGAPSSGGLGGGLFGGGRGRRRQLRTQELLNKHVLEELAAARLFNDVHIAEVQVDRRGRRRLPKSGQRAEHVLLCGDTLLVVASLQIPSQTAHWDGRVLRASGRALSLPNLSGQARRLRETVQSRISSTYGRESFLRVGHQMILHSPDGSLLSPVVETSSAGDAPLAAGRGLRRIVDQLASSSRANVIDRYLMGALRDQLHSPQDTR